MTWAQRLKRVFNIDIETCTECGGPVKAIACIKDPVVIKHILDHLKHKAETNEPSALPGSRLWRKSGRVFSDVVGIQAHSGLSNGYRVCHSQSMLLLDQGEKGVYSSYAQVAVWRCSVGNIPGQLAGFFEHGIFHGTATYSKK